jgi:acetate kinase
MSQSRSSPSHSSVSSADASIILTVNAGSSSIKFAGFNAATSLRLFSGQLERVGSTGATFAVKHPGSTTSETLPPPGATFEACVQSLLTHLRTCTRDALITGIGHRIVHGGVRLLEHQRITPEVLDELRRAVPLDIDHLPSEIALVDSFAKSFPAVTQIACFDTAFHRDLPRVAQLLPVPRCYVDAGLRKFGFHGLSYTYLMDALVVRAGHQAANGRVILAHLGAGASMSAVRGGRPIDTTMSFTPNAGLVMSTRPGDIDPGLLLYLMNDQQLSPDQMGKFIGEQCGLLGVSGTTGDMRDLLARRSTDFRAAEAIDLFCYHARKHLCALVGTLGGIDTLIFTGGIGQHSPDVRADICRDLNFIDLRVDPEPNQRNDDVISTADSQVVIRVMRTDEESIIARAVVSLLPPRPTSV